MRTSGSIWYAATAIATLLAFVGCATIITGGDQKMNIASEPSQATVTILDSEGNQLVSSQTPVTARLKKADGFFKGATYKIKIEKSGYKTQEVILKPDLNAGWYILGNLVVGGLFGWLIVDPLTGGMWTLSPGNFNAQLGGEGSYIHSDKDNIVIVLLQDLPDGLKLQMQPVQPATTTDASNPAQVAEPAAPAQALPKATIGIDGEFGDWNSVAPLIIQNAADKSSVSKVFLSQDKENFYVRLDIADRTPSSFLHAHNFNEGIGDYFYAINIDNGNIQNNVSFRIVHWIPPWGGRSGWHLELCRREKGHFHHLDSNKPENLPSIGQYAMQGSSLEMSVPLAKLRKALGDPGSTGKYRVFGWTGKGWDDISDSRQTDAGYFSFQELN